MTTKAEWLALAERCEKAKGPDQSIDVWIENYCGIAEFIQPHTWRASIDSPERGRIRPLTASLDAITALIERELPGWYCTSTHIPPEFRSDETLPFDASLVGNIREEQFGYDEPPELTHAVHPGAGATEPLARCAAFCRAMAEKEPT
jgi:hypothetical protein